MFRRALLICDDYWHPGQVPVDGVAPLKEQGFQFDIIFDAKNFRPETLSDYSVVLLVKSDQTSAGDKSSWKTEAVQKAFISYVESGGGLLAIHSGVVGCMENHGLDELIGCKLSSHPHDCPVIVQAIKPHPVTKGVEVFCETDEHYRLEILSPDVDILMASYSPPQGTPDKYEEDPYNNTPAWICPAAYVRKQGKGRVCVLSPGHLLPVWLNQQFQRTLANAIRWAAGE